MSSLRILSTSIRRFTLTSSFSHSSRCPFRSFSHFTSAEVYEQEDHHISTPSFSSSVEDVPSSFHSISRTPSVSSVASPVALPPVAHLHASAAAAEPSSAKKVHLALNDYDADVTHAVMETAGFNVNRKEW